jgi:RHH-type transcriptional regulator, rel operon repressor / antitoxin RelB
MLALRLPPEIERRLDELARRTGRTKSYFAREAIIRHLEDMAIAEERLREAGESLSWEEVKARLFDDQHR